MSRLKQRVCCSRVILTVSEGACPAKEIPTAGESNLLCKLEVCDGSAISLRPDFDGARLRLSA